MSLSETFIENTETFHNSACKVGFLRNLAADFGIGNITYLATSIRGRCPLPHGLMTTYSKKWVTYYFEKSFDLVDPVVFYAAKRSLPLDWQDIPLSGRKVRQFFSVAEDFGVHKVGVTLPVRCSAGGEALISLGATDQPSEWVSIMRHKVPELIYFSHLLHKEILNIRPEEDPVLSKDLSFREREVLRWAADGKTSWETGKILNLSERTVNFYITNACKKLDAANKTQAVAIALRNNSLGFAWKD